MKHGGKLSTVVLASSSLRRREIMNGVVNRVEAVSPNVAEGPQFAGESAAKYVARLAAEKAASAPGPGFADVVLAADTLVALDDRLFGKPRTEAAARAMLDALRDRPHSVLTGVAVRDPHTGRGLTDVKESTVEMRNYASEEIEQYLRTDAPMDRAGAYGVQDEVFSPVKAVEGCYLNVVGLPMCTVVELLTGLGAHVALRPRDRVPYLASCLACELDDRVETKA